MNVYLLLRLVDGCAYTTEGVFADMNKAEKVMARLSKENNWIMKVEVEKVR